MIVMRRLLDRALGAVLSALMGFAVVNVLWQVASRSVLGDPSPYTDELARYLLIWIGLLGAAYGVGQHLHVAVDLVPESLVKRFGLTLSIGVSACVMCFALTVLIFGGLSLVVLTVSLRQTSAALGLPIGVVYLALPLSGLLIFAYCLLDIVELLEHRSESSDV